MSKVYLAGAGPGDPELLTLKTRRLLEQAGAVLYDRFTPPALLDLAPPRAERLDVSEKPSRQICELLIECARRGLQVVRLEAGDPLFFGRGGEEARALAAAGVPFEIVPGITSPVGIAAYTGVPLTGRVTLLAPDAPAPETLMVLDAETDFARIARELIAEGRSPETPAMAVRWGTRPEQRTLAGTLATLPALMQEHDFQPPATVIIGEVVARREDLGWFERLPLFGRRIVVTRARGQAEALSAKLRALGAEALDLPTIEIRPAPDYGPLDRAIARLPEYDWLIFTSANGVRFFLERLDRSAVDLRALRARLCAIGPATRAALEALHLKVDLMGADYVAEGLLAAFAGHDLQGRRILLPRAAVARDLAPAELARRGAHVDVVEAYRTAIPEEAPRLAAAIFQAPRKPHWITFTSSSTVRNFAAVAPAGALDGVEAASIGPVTSATARQLGIHVTVEAPVFTTDGLVDAILRAVSRPGT
jgi:uroporphyrinogen III methyltransferase / synthase